jgi:hypothetical protein
MAYTDKQIDYIIRLGKRLEYQKLEREAIALQEAKKLVDKSEEIIEKRRELEDIKYNLKRIRYNIENPDPGVDLGNGFVRVSICKSLPKELEDEYDF